MLILSKFRDFYDGAVGMGIDKTITYERHLKEMVCPEDIQEHLKLDWLTNFTGNINDDDNTSFVIIGFCGKLYLGFKFIKEIKNKNPNDITKQYDIKIIYDVEEARKKYKFKKRKHRKWYNTSDTAEQNFDKFIKKINDIDPTEWFRRFNTPIFAFGTSVAEITNWGKRHKDTDGNDFFINPNLKEYQFMKVFDSYTAFQEIQMYVSGVLGTNEDGMDIKMTEKQKVVQHGMNKWSFRRESNK